LVELCCHLSDKNYRLPDNLPRCQALSANRLSHITWRGIVSRSFFVLHLFFSRLSSSLAPRYLGDAPGNA
jgi:hypothetical protein